MAKPKQTPGGALRARERSTAAPTAEAAGEAGSPGPTRTGRGTRGPSRALHRMRPAVGSMISGAISGSGR